MTHEIQEAAFAFDYRKMTSTESIQVQAIIYSARVDRDGTWKVTLEIPMSEGAHVAALTAYTETVFKVQFTPEENE